MIGLGVVLAGMAWGRIDRNLGLISSNPAEFVSAALWTIGLPALPMSEMLKSESRTARISILDLLFTLLLTIIAVVGLLGWLLIVAPVSISRVPDLRSTCKSSLRITFAGLRAVFAGAGGRTLTDPKEPALPEADGLVGSLAQQETRDDLRRHACRRHCPSSTGLPNLGASPVSLNAGTT